IYRQPPPAIIYPLQHHVDLCISNSSEKRGVSKKDTQKKQNLESRGRREGQIQTRLHTHKYTQTQISFLIHPLVMTAAVDQVAASLFYNTWHGHCLEDLQIVHRNLLKKGYTRLVWLAGDSSLDNKYWVHPRVASTR